jgi:hypothetical protein
MIKPKFATIGKNVGWQFPSTCYETGNRQTKQNSIRGRTDSPNRHQLSLHIEYFGHRDFQCGGNFECEEDGRIRLTTLNAHDRLATDARAERQLLLSHAPIETKASEVIAEGDSSSHEKRDEEVTAAF